MARSRGKGGSSIDTPLTTTQFFDATSRDFSGRYAASPAFRERYALCIRAIDRALEGAAPGALSIDLGCGDGRYAHHAATRGCRSIGIDQSAEMLALARDGEDEAAAGGRCEYRLASLPLPEDTVAEFEGAAALITCFSVLEYVDDAESVLRQIARMLAPGGAALLTLANRQSVFWSVQRALARLVRARILPSRMLGHMAYQRHQFAPSTVAAALGEMGLECEPAVYYCLPFQRITARLVRGRPGRRSATLFLLRATRRPASHGIAPAAGAPPSH